MNKWIIREPDRVIAESLRRTTGLPDFVCRLLAAKGITSYEEADLFFNNREFSDPFDIKDMEKAVAIINEAIENGTSIMIYGDYDCDGVTSTYILYNYLEAMGAEAAWYIPTRDEGYGLNMKAIDLFAKQGVELIITVDNGITAEAEAEHIRELGMRLIITDHHEVPEKLPYAEAILNPHRRDDISQYKNLAGCGVVLKLLMALQEDNDAILSEYGDIVALGTIADLVRLDGENRIIASEGLQIMSRTSNEGLKWLLKKTGIEQGEEILSEKISFYVAPKINAAGRCASPQEAVELLLCDNQNSAAAKAERLTELNDARKETEKQIIEDIENQIRRDPDLLNKRILIVSGDGWKHGIIGIASSKLMHKYGKPCIIITKEGKTSRGSCRSNGDLSIAALITHCRDMLIHGGGHLAAGGFTLDTERIAEFTDRVYEFCGKTLGQASCEEINVDMTLSAADVTVDNVNLLKNFEPFGMGNQVPVFLLPGCVIKAKKPRSDGKYTAMDIDFGGRQFGTIDFDRSYDSLPYEAGDTVDIVGLLEINEYNGYKSVQIRVSDIRYSGFRQDRYIAAKTAYEDYRCGRVDRRLLCRMVPEVEEMRSVYKLLRSCTCLSKAETIVLRGGMNLCKFRIILDVFAEFRLAETDIPADTVRLLPVNGKVNLETSKIIAALKAC
ncbi:MAG: single-stranded-DNA-specific exonuclease RecJ [Ruminiclostridium sp.]|nr:single-stranded-DNA-specific exonuclease RecJ [Ruminiclostridium sp.]